MRFVFEQSVLMNEAGAADGGGGAPPATTVTAPSSQERWSNIMAAVEGTPVEGSAQQPAEPQYEEDWRAKLPKPKPATSVVDRIAEKRARAAAQPIELQLQQTRQQLQQVTQAQKQADMEFQRKLQSGDIDEAFAMKGLSLKFEDLQRQMMVKHGMITNKDQDPQLLAIQKQLAEERAIRQRQELAQRRTAQQQAQQKQFEQDLQEVSNEIAQLPYRDAQDFATLPGVNKAVLDILELNSEMDVTSAAALTYEHYSKLYQQLAKVYGPRQAPGPQVPRALPPQMQQQQQPQERRPPSGAGIPLPAIPKELTGEAKWQAIMATVNGATNR